MSAINEWNKDGPDYPSDEERCDEGFCHIAEARGEQYRCQGNCAYKGTAATALSAAPVQPSEQVGVPREVLEKLEWDDDLDETACPTGWVTCRICDGGGAWDKRHKRPPTHKHDCPLGNAMLAAAGKDGV